MSTGLVGKLVEKAKSAIRDMGARHALRQELLECDRLGVLDDLLTDLNLNRHELGRLTENYPLSSKLFGAMAERLGVDPSQSDASTRQELQHTCSLCSHQIECKHWLQGFEEEGFEEFCPNADYWNTLRARISGALSRKAILVATDGSPSADRAVDTAADMAKAADSDLYLVSVAHLPPRSEYGAANLDPGLKALMNAEKIPLPELYESIAGEVLSKAAKRAASHQAPRIHTVIRSGEHGETADAILDIAREHKAGFIVVGRRGLGRWGGLLHHSVSQKLAAEAHCKVIVVP
jgi:nucleotide-binding universal stress UspA family protein